MIKCLQVRPVAASSRWVRVISARAGVDTGSMNSQTPAVTTGWRHRVGRRVRRAWQHPRSGHRVAPVIRVRP